IHRNIIRESSGDPKAINLWDINARNGIPSKGLLQVIDPTFNRFHVAGTSHNIYDPVANITAACNYAADRYGTMDNVNSAY
ncbi:transglycosylase SLT domain-containing protein, partial [Streptomyces sp. NRRL F-5123]